jgi:hypothetical protein
VAWEDDAQTFTESVPGGAAHNSGLP